MTIGYRTRNCTVKMLVTEIIDVLCSKRAITVLEYSTKVVLRVASNRDWCHNLTVTETVGD